MGDKIDLDYINNRLADPKIKLICNDCGYKWEKSKKIDIEDLEDFEDYRGHDHCPMCGSKNIEETT